MQTVMTLVRALHFAALLSLAGGLAFAALVAEPALRKHAADGGTAAFRARLIRLIWASLALGVLSGLHVAGPGSAQHERPAARGGVLPGPSRDGADPHALRP